MFIPIWVRLLHWFNFLFLSMLMRSGLEILSAHPKLYWNEHCHTGSEWLRFTRKRFTDERMFASTDEEEEWPAWVALPGHGELGLGRYWHFLAGTGWIVCGVLYMVLMFAGGRWQALVPTSWEIFPEAFRDALMYLQWQTPAEGHPYNALQQLTYFGVIFFLAPLQIYTGIAMSPAFSNRFLWPDRLLGGRQAVRSLHFIGLVTFLLFLGGHLTMVVWHGVAFETAKMVFGDTATAHRQLAPWIVLGIIGAVVTVHVVATRASLRHGRATRRVLGKLWDPLRTFLLHPLRARSTRPETNLTPIHHMNGYPPLDFHPSAQGTDMTYEYLMLDLFANYALEVSGDVEHNLLLTLDDLRAMPYHSTVQTHFCIQGWSGIAKWGGVRVSEILKRCQPRSTARYVAFISFQRHEKAFERQRIEVPYYECIDMTLAMHPETLLAFDMNDKSLPVRHGAPLRLRLGSALGFKMVKYLRRIALIDDIKQIGDGMGGCREDMLHFDMGAEI